GSPTCGSASSLVTRMAGSSRSTVTMAAVRPISIGVRTDSVIAPSYPDPADTAGPRTLHASARVSSPQIQTEWPGLRRGRALANHLDRRHHAPVATKHAIGERHDAHVWGCGCRCLA